MGNHTLPTSKGNWPTAALWYSERRVEKQGHPEEHWAQVDGARIHYLMSGTRGSPLVLVHGGATDSATLSWGSSIQTYGQTHRVAAPDLPGFGLSEKPRTNYTLEYYTRFLKNFTQTIGFDRCSLIGLSLGGQISLNFALRFPERVDRLVLVSCAGLGIGIHWTLAALLLVKAPRLHTSLRKIVLSNRKRVKLSLRSIVYEPSVIGDDLLDQIVASTHTPGAGRAWRSYLKNELCWLGFRHNFLPRLCEISAPTLIVHGDSDKLIPVRLAEKAHHLISRSELCVLPRCGHWPPRETPADFNRAVLKFLDRSSQPA